MKQIKTAVIFSVAVLVSCTVRICQLLFMTDPATGFFYPRYQTLGTALTVLYVAIFAVSAIVSFSEMRGTVKLPGRTVPYSVVMVVAVAASLFELPDMWGASQNMVIRLLLAASVIGMALFFLAEASRGIPAAEFPESARKWLVLMPVCFWLIRTVMAFSRYMTIANISENVFDLAAMGFLTFFFLVYSKVINGVETAKSARMVEPLGIIASLVCLICSVPRYAAHIFATGLLHETTPPDIIYIVMAAAVIMLLPRRIVRVASKNEE